MANTTVTSADELIKIVSTLTTTIEELKATINKLNATILDLENQNALLLEENKYLKRKIFGTKSETSHSLGFEQLSLFDEPEKECDQELLEEITYTRAVGRHKDDIKVKLSNLKHIEELYTLDENERVCNICGEVMHKVGKELIRSEVVYEPAKLYVKDIYRETYECRNCRKNNLVHMYKAPTPNPVIPHSYVSSTALTQLIIDKFVNHLPLYRQEAEWKRLGLELSRATMANWLIIAAKEYFIPLVDRLHELLIKEKHLHADETVIQVLNEPGKDNTSKSYMWVYSSIKECQTPIKIFDYRPDRAAKNPQEFLNGFKGVAITDAYQGYNNLEGVTHAFCWAHCRRKFRDAIPEDVKNPQATLAKEAINKIAKLFAIESEIEDKSPEEKLKIRQFKSKPLVDDFFSWCNENQNMVLSKSKLGKAFQYSLNCEAGLRKFLDDGFVPLTNSLDERSIRPFTIGRKNWLFSGSPKGAKASAAIFSIIETAKANKLDPYDYVEYLLDLMPNENFNTNKENLDNYLPWSEQIKKAFEIK